MIAPDVNVPLYAFREESERHNCTYVTTDQDYARFPRLRWPHALNHARPKLNPS